ncbi:hypothetical protein BC833DRAFT_576188 [Globomyces pollinis-pini]|nr:hypothetical protein BC833DRAFT_576188 [Globomyces pollinis-pini]
MTGIQPTKLSPIDDPKYPVQPPTIIPKWKSYSSILIHSIKGSSRSFLISFLLRGGVSFIVRLILVYRKKSTLLVALRNSMGLETQRFASMIATFSFLWKFVSNSLYYHFGTISKVHGAIAGAIAGLAVLIETKPNRITIAQQFSMRSLQGIKNALKQRNLFSFPHGDTFLFSIAVASIMYAYTMRPDTIPKSYYNWVVQHGRVPKVMVELNRQNTRQHQLGYHQADLGAIEKALTVVNAPVSSLHKVLEYIKRNGGTMPNVPCAALHAKESSCTKYCTSVFGLTFLDMIPVYMSLNTVPLLLFKTKSVLLEPLKSIWRVLKSTTQSCLFLSTYVTMFQTGLCLHRSFFPTHTEKYLFYYLGLVTGLSVLVEKKSKRGELAMYVLPKGLQSLYTILIANGTICAIPGLEVAATCLSMSGIMALYQTEPHQLSPLLYKMFKGVLDTY